MPLPEDAQANDVAALPEGGFVTTKMLPRDAGVFSMLRIALGLATGELLEWSAADGWRAVPGTRASAPNGVAASPDGQTLYLRGVGRLEAGPRRRATAPGSASSRSRTIPTT